jgi:RNA polymerase sigma factor (sigma-70 family)
MAFPECERRGGGSEWPASAKNPPSTAANPFAARRRLMLKADDADLQERLEEALLNMPRIQREIFLAIRLDDMSYEEIGRRTGLTVKQVERHFARSLNKLVKQMDGERLSWWERRF